MKNAITHDGSCLLSIAEAAWLLGVDNSAVYRAIQVGVLPVVQRRRRVLIPAHVLAHLADDLRTDPPAGAAGRGGAA